MKRKHGEDGKVPPNFGKGPGSRNPFPQRLWPSSKESHSQITSITCCSRLVPLVPKNSWERSSGWLCMPVSQCSVLRRSCITEETQHSPASWLDVGSSWNNKIQHPLFSPSHDRCALCEHLQTFQGQRVGYWVCWRSERIGSSREEIIYSKWALAWDSELDWSPDTYLT